jgi:magnesium transporter
MAQLPRSHAIDNSSLGPENSTGQVIRAFLYEAVGKDREVDLTPDLLAEVGDQSLVWVDLASRSADDIEAAGAVLNIEPSSISDLLRPKRTLRVDNYGGYYQFSLFVAPTASASMHSSGDGSHSAKTGRAAAEGDEVSSRLCFVVGDRWLLTVHDEDLEFLRGFRDQDKAETKIGGLSSQALAASLLDWHLESWFIEVGRIYVVIDKLD